MCIDWAVAFLSGDGGRRYLLAGRANNVFMGRAGDDSVLCLLSARQRLEKRNFAGNLFFAGLFERTTYG